MFYSSASNMKELCDSLVQKGYLNDKRVYNAMIKVDRKDFCPNMPYVDTPQPINYNVTISAPLIHSYCLELLKDHLFEGAKALDVGFGSGYLTAAMSEMIGNKGCVVGIEHIQQLCEFAKNNISKHHKEKLDNKKIILVQGDGRQGYKDLAPYDCIHVGAAAPKIPEELIKQLNFGGRLVIPVGGQREDQYIYIIDKDKNGKITQRREMGVIFVPLTSVEKQLHG